MKHKKTASDIIDSLVAARTARKLSQNAIARSLDMPQSYISRLESGQIDLRLSTLLDLARFFNLELMFVPSCMVPAVKSLLQDHASSEQDQPLYQLDDIEQEED